VNKVDSVDWTLISSNPCDPKGHKSISNYLEGITDVWGNSRTSNLLQMFEDKDILDIGAGEHSPELYSEATWEHGFIKKVAKTTLGLDIRPELVDHYNKKGFSFKCVDATGEDFLGTKFDVVFVGDVVEHVNNPVKLLEFSKRHLKENGLVILTTPNPYSLSWILARLIKRNRLYIGNLDHVFWVSATNALELGRRAGLVLSAVHLANTNRKPTAGFRLRQIILKIAGLVFSSECCHDECVYVYKIPSTK
jgi:2-polyprenyl-3-methyl-5-hydroxy-6-metoxy-1,4-benzoquinol methylase